MRRLIALLVTVFLLLNIAPVFADEDKAYSITVVHNNKDSQPDKFIFDGKAVQLEALKKLGYPSVEVITSKVRDFVRLKLKAADKDLRSFHAVLNADGSVEGNFAYFDAKRNKQSYNFSGKLEK